jgi:hypothetical protein
MKLLSAGPILGLFFDPESGSDMFLGTVGRFSTENSSYLNSFYEKFITRLVTKFATGCFDSNNEFKDESMLEVDCMVHKSTFPPKFNERLTHTSSHLAYSV